MLLEAEKDVSKTLSTVPDLKMALWSLGNRSDS